MKPPLSWLLRLYPARWRSRYEAELEALVDDTGSGWKYATDILIEALKMRFLSIDWRFVGGFALAGLVLAYAGSFAIPNRYVSKAVLQLESVSGDLDRKSVMEELIRRQDEALSRTSLANIIQSPNLNLYKSERLRQPLEDVIETMKAHHVQIMLVRKAPTSRVRGELFVISFSSDEPGRASRTVDQIVQHFVDPGRSFNREGHSIQRSEFKVTVLESPSLPQHPVFPNHGMFGLLGASIGLVAYFITAWIRRNHSAGPQPA